MLHKNLPISSNNEQEQLLLKAKINLVQQELNEIDQKINAFEAILRFHLENEIIEEQELTVLYKKLQLAKKLRRLAQKKKGKNFKEVEGLKVSSTNSRKTNSLDEQKEKKRLYREAMLFVHPDKFSMHYEKIDLATDITSKLIEIYQSGNLAELQIFHTHIFSGNAMMQCPEISEKNVTAKEDSYLQNELEELEKQLHLAKTKHTYKVLMEYENPMMFIEELKEYYHDRIFKLKKRTRKANLYDL